MREAGREPGRREGVQGRGAGVVWGAVVPVAGAGRAWGQGL